MKKILITGINSYIGNSLERYLAAYQKDHKEAAHQEDRNEAAYQIDRISLRDDTWKQISFTGYDAIFHVAGIAHADVGKVSDEAKAMYYRINCDLAEQAASKAKAEGVKQFIYMSSVIVYGDSAPVGQRKYITADTKPDPANFYGDSKYQAELKLQKLQTDDFRIAIIRAPMIYGKGSKGNFSLLVKLAAKAPVFPDIQNERSMLYMENLAEFIRRLTEAGSGGTFFPQNAEYVTTAEMVRLIGETLGRKVRLWKVLNPFVKLASNIPGKIGGMTNKAFGSLTVDKGLSSIEGNFEIIDRKLSNIEGNSENIGRELSNIGENPDIIDVGPGSGNITDYQIYSLEESIKRSI